MQSLLLVVLRKRGHYSSNAYAPTERDCEVFGIMMWQLGLNTDISDSASLSLNLARIMLGQPMLEGSPSVVLRL